jgi:hypothetical protein
LMLGIFTIENLSGRFVAVRLLYALPQI